jgi:2'-5' RNA ligase
VSHGATARLFAAVDPPLEVREELAEWAREAAAAMPGAAAGAPSGGLRLLAADLIHLTVCFLGARPVAELAALAGALERCAAHACELSTGAPLWLPPRRPRALAVAVDDPDGELGRLHEDLVGALAAVSGWEPERRRFRAHITVARMRGGGARAREHHHTGAPLPATPRLRFAPESLCLYRSRLGQSGASYEALARCTLLPAGG